MFVGFMRQKVVHNLVAGKLHKAGTRFCDFGRKLENLSLPVYSQ